MRKGRRLALDVGKARIGMAICDPDAILATPLEASKRLDSIDDSIAQVLERVSDYELLEVIVGDPVSLSGNQSDSTLDAREFAIRFQIKTGLPVRLVDERLSTVSAASNLRAAGKNAKSSKQYIDSASAVVILEAALRQETLTGEPAGELVGENYGS